MKKCLLILAALALLPTLAVADEYVHGYVRRDGTVVQPYYRSSPDHNPYNNYSYPGNTNPHTGQVAPGNPNTYLNNYNRNSGSGFGTWDNNAGGDDD